MTILTLTMRAEYVEQSRDLISNDRHSDIGRSCPACIMLNSELPGPIPATVNVAPPLKFKGMEEDPALNEITLPDGRMAKAGEKLKLAIYAFDAMEIEHAVFPPGLYEIEVDD